MSRFAEIRSIASYLPEQYVGNAELATCFPAWTEEKMVRKLGIERRPISADNETAVDMGVKAAEKLFENGNCEPENIDFLIFCTQSPDYFLPTSACLIHEQLGLPKSCGALDFNLGCSGYVYGLSLCKGLIETGMAKNVLFITSETYTKFINPMDRVTRPLFGDGASATWISTSRSSIHPAHSENTKSLQSEQSPIGPFVFGTDGSGADLLIVPAGGLRMPKSLETEIEIQDDKGCMRSQNQLKMHGPGIFSFAIDRVPPLVEELLAKSGKTREEIGCFVFHQANRYMLDRLREICSLDSTRYFNDMMHRGNTVSSSIPIAMVDAWKAGMIKPNEWTMLVGFGVGLSWAGTLVNIPSDFVGIE
ncbi:MAG: 3-oxoacyl-ACP synthase III family protein [Thermoguttaceae bacterium]